MASGERERERERERMGKESNSYHWSSRCKGLCAGMQRQIDVCKELSSTPKPRADQTSSRLFMFKNPSLSADHHVHCAGLDKL